MKILVNASTLVVGGGIQVGVSFIEQALNSSEFHWLFLVSDGIYNNLDAKIRIDNRVVNIKKRPSKIFEGRESRKIIKMKARKFKPDLIYSIGFPSYINFSEIEIGRYTNPWEINSKPLPWKVIKGFFKKLIIRFGIIYRLIWARKADFIETQTEAAKIGIFKRAFFPLEKIIVIPNSVNQIFLEEGETAGRDRGFEQEDIVFCLSANYEHKNLVFIPDVANYLRFKLNKEVKFILTIPEDSILWKNIKEKCIRKGVEDLIENAGNLKLKECILYYRKAKVVFLPTLLEVFSVTYLEAMAMRVPIVTSDLSFARDNCKDAALFFKPGDSKDAATCIKSLLEDRELYYKLINRGVNVLNNYPTLDQKYSKLFDYFKLIIQNGKI
jgi:glycosyltransferase involved in cell wall biosynthesis